MTNGSHRGAGDDAVNDATNLGIDSLQDAWEGKKLGGGKSGKTKEEQPSSATKRQEGKSASSASHRAQHPTAFVQSDAEVFSSSSARNDPRERRGPRTHAGERSLSTHPRTEGDTDGTRPPLLGIHEHSGSAKRHTSARSNSGRSSGRSGSGRRCQKSVHDVRERRKSQSRKPRRKYKSLHAHEADKRDRALAASNQTVSESADAHDTSGDSNESGSENERNRQAAAHAAHTGQSARLSKPLLSASELEATSRVMDVKTNRVYTWGQIRRHFQSEEEAISYTESSCIHYVGSDKEEEQGRPSHTASSPATPTARASNNNETRPTPPKNTDVSAHSRGGRFEIEEDEDMDEEETDGNTRKKARGIEANFEEAHNLAPVSVPVRSGSSVTDASTRVNSQASTATAREVSLAPSSTGSVSTLPVPSGPLQGNEQNTSVQQLIDDLPTRVAGIIKKEIQSTLQPIREEVDQKIHGVSERVQQIETQLSHHELAQKGFNADTAKMAQQLSDLTARMERMENDKGLSSDGRVPASQGLSNLDRLVDTTILCIGSVQPFPFRDAHKQLQRFLDELGYHKDEHYKFVDSPAAKTHKIQFLGDPTVAMECVSRCLRNKKKSDGSWRDFSLNVPTTNGGGALRKIPLFIEMDKNDRTKITDAALRTLTKLLTRNSSIKEGGFFVEDIRKRWKDGILVICGEPCIQVLVDADGKCRLRWENQNIPKTGIKHLAGFKEQLHKAFTAMVGSFSD